METPSIWSSRKFWLAIIDAFVSTLAIMLAFWLSPDKVTQIMVLVGIWQPVIIAVIVSYTVQNVAAIQAKSDVAQAAQYSGNADPGKPLQ